LNDQAQFIQVGVKVANGGYVVHALTKQDDEWGWTTSVFTSMATLTAYIQRVTTDLEGADEWKSKFGGMNVPSEPNS
jgi:hypothetical protein